MRWTSMSRWTSRHIFSCSKFITYLHYLHKHTVLTTKAPLDEHIKICRLPLGSRISRATGRPDAARARSTLHIEALARHHRPAALPPPPHRRRRRGSTSGFRSDEAATLPRLEA